MPRAKLSNVSLKQLVAELKKRQARLKAIIKQRDALNAEIKELQGLESPASAPAPKVAAKAKKGRKRRTYSETAEQFILGLLKSKPATSKQINAAWKKSRTGRADNTLNKMLKAKKVKRTKLPKGQKGSTYSLV